MNKLKVIDFHGKEVIDSREVAAMVGKNHAHLLRDIAGYIKILAKPTESKIGLSGAELKIEPSDFFLESSYKDSTGRELPCYLITKKGCDMVANKLIGEKGVLFTAAYVTAFEEMRQALTAPAHPMLPENVTFSSAVGFMRLTRRVMLDMGASPFDVGMMIKETCEAISFPVPPSLKKQLPGQTSLWDRPTLETQPHSMSACG